MAVVGGAVRAEFVNPFVLAGMRAIESVMGAAPEAGQPAVRSATSTTQQVSIVIGVSGAVEGQAVYGMSLVTATKLAAAISGVTTVTFDEGVSNAITELGTMIADRATTLLSEAGYETRADPPALVRGVNVEVPTSAPALVVPLYTDFGKIEVNVALRASAPLAGAAGAATAPRQAPEADQKDA